MHLRRATSKSKSTGAIAAIVDRVVPLIPILAVVPLVLVSVLASVGALRAREVRPGATLHTQDLVVDNSTHIGGSLFETYAGNPNGALAAPKGSTVMDKNTPAIWQNLDGATTWQQVGSSLNTNHVEMTGDSNAYGNGDTDHLSDQQLVPPYAPVQMNALIGAGIPFVAQHTVPDQDLQPFGPGGFANMGYELSLGRYLNVAGRTGTKIGKFACQGADLPRYIPSGDLYPLLTGYLDARVADWGVLGVLYWDIGSNDSADATNAANWAANFTTVNTALRQRYGNFLVVYRQIGPVLSAGHPFVSVVRAQQVRYAGLDPNSILVNADYVPLSADNLHYDANGYELVGWVIGTAVASALGPAQALYQSGLPLYVGAGLQASGGGTLSPVEFPVPQVPSYFDVLVVGTGLVSGAGAATLSNPAGFVLLGHGTSTFAGLDQNITVFYRRATARFRGTPTVADNNDFNAARIFTFRQPTTTSGSPFDTAGVFSANNTFGTAISVTGDTTLTDNDLVAIFTANFAGSTAVNTTGWANATLGGFALLEQNVLEVPAANAEVLTLATGTKVTAGAFGASTATSTANLVGAYVALSIKP